MLLLILKYACKASFAIKEFTFKNLCAINFQMAHTIQSGYDV